MSAVGEITTLAKAASNQASLRTVVPMSIIKQWKLEEGDRIEWEWKVIDGDMVLVVKKSK